MESGKSQRMDYRSSKYHRDLRQSITKYFSIDELRLVAHDLGLDWDNLPGESKPIKILELIEYYARRNELVTLINTIQRERPAVNWPGYPKGSLIHLQYDYKVAGKTQEGVPFSNFGKASSVHEIEGEYYDDGLAFAEAVAATADHCYKFDVEKMGYFGLSQIDVSIKNLELRIELPEEES